MGKGASQTIGYRYYMGLHMGLGRGPVDEIVEIRVDDLAAWPQAGGDYTVSATFATYEDLYGGALFAEDGVVAHVTSDPDTDLNGYYRKVGSSWQHLGGALGSGAITDTTTAYIDAPNLFGGDDKEGGIQGPLQVLMGKIDQVCPSNISLLMSGIVPAFRGVVTLFFNGLICSMNPYPKSWSVRVRRAVKGWYNDAPWYPEKAVITLTGYSDANYPIGTIKAMNGAHILYECATNPEWGYGLPPEMINGSSFRWAADTLYNENFGLCAAWTRQEDIDVFAQMIIDHIGAAIYVDRVSGLLTLKLIRGDYDPGALPLYDTENGLLDIVEDDSSSQDASYNEIIVNFTEAVTGKDASVRVQNIAAWQATEQFVSTTTQYQAVPTKELATRLGLRDLNVQAVGLKKFKITFDRRGWRIAPGSVFRISDPKKNIANIVLRAGQVEDGTATDGTITVTALQDVFGLPATAYVKGQASGWTPPPTTPQAVTHYRAIEVPYRDLARNLSTGDLAAITDDDCFVAGIAARPAGNALNYILYTKTSGEPDYEQRSGEDFAPSATLTGAIGPYDTAISFDNMSSFETAVLGIELMIDDEICRLDAINVAAGTATIARGCSDTIPAPHAVGARLYLMDDFLARDTRTYTDSEVISEKFLTRTSAGRTEVISAPSASVTTDQRQARPFPPGDVRLDDGLTTPRVYDLTTSDIFTGDFDITWVDRDRLQQADHLLEHGGAGVGPESGTTYTIRVYSGVTLLRTDAAATSPWTYDSSMAITDGDPPHPRFELVSVRDGLESFYKHSFVVNRDSTGGWGQDWGENWGRV